MPHWKRIKVEAGIHAMVKANAAMRGVSLQYLTAEALCSYLPLLDAARTAVITGDTEALAKWV